MHFPGSHLRLTLSAILPCEARTFLTVIPFGDIPRDRPAELHYNYSISLPVCQSTLVSSSSDGMGNALGSSGLSSGVLGDGGRAPSKVIIA